MAHSNQTGRAAAFLLPALLATLLGCTSDGDDPAPGVRSADPSAAAEAQRLCTRALKGADVASAAPATLGEIRAHGIGPGTKPGKGAFGTAADGDFGAWCWTKTGPKAFTSYGVGADGSAVLFASVRDFATTAPSGAPVIP